MSEGSPDENPPEQSQKRRTILVVTPAYKWILISVVGITVLALAAEVYLSLKTSDENRSNVHFALTTCDWVVKSGLGAVLGLIAGKATR